MAVMRRLATIVWHVLKRKTTYQFHYDPIATAQKKTKPRKKSRSGFVRHDNNAVCIAKGKAAIKTPSPPKRQTKANGP